CRYSGKNPRLRPRQGAPPRRRQGRRGGPARAVPRRRRAAAAQGGGVAPRRTKGRRPMAITLNHTIVPARDKAAAAKFFARIFGLKRGRTSHFAPVRVNKALTLLFDDDAKFESHHYAFHVSDKEFSAIFGRVQKA